jgi:hypothetical protein
MDEDPGGTKTYGSDGSVAGSAIRYGFGIFLYNDSSLGRYVFGSEISYNKPPPRLPGLAC